MPLINPDNINCEIKLYDDSKVTEPDDYQRFISDVEKSIFNMLTGANKMTDKKDYGLPDVGEAPKSEIMQYFEYKHLPPQLQIVSKTIYDVAHAVDGALVASAEKSAGLRKLLEAKDCFVRAAMSSIEELRPEMNKDLRGPDL